MLVSICYRLVSKWAYYYWLIEYINIMSYTPTTEKEVSMLPQCENCKQYCTRLDYHNCNRCIECNEIIDNSTNNCNNCHDNCRLEL